MYKRQVRKELFNLDRGYAAYITASCAIILSRELVGLWYCSKWMEAKKQRLFTFVSGLLAG